MTQLAFLGTGVMGLPMARNLSGAGFVVHAYNRTLDKARSLQGEGVELFDDPAAAADGCPLMVTMLADGDVVREVARRALTASDPPEVWIQMATIGSAATERCAALADAHDVTFVDAPVVGTRAPAQDGALVILGSGPESARPAVDPVFAAVGSRTLWLGEAGAGSRAKIAINSWIVGVVGALAETLALAQALEVDPDTFFAAVNGGPLDLGYARIKGPAMISGDFSDVSMTVDNMHKDAELILAAAAEAGLELPMLRAASGRLATVASDGHGDEDMAATYRASPPPPGA